MTIGIYEIYNIKNHKRYIGSSINIERRWSEHLRSLNSNTHHSIKLQRAWNKANDEEIFKTNILQIYDGNDINELFGYEKYFTNDYYIRLFNNNFWITSNDNKITYEYIFKNNKINRYNVYCKCILIDNEEDRKQYEYK